MTQPKRLFIKTYGCQMNVYDSERMADVLRPLGYAHGRRAGRRRPGGAQHLPHPREGGREGLFRARPPQGLREEKAAAGGGRMTIAVAGCVAQAEGAGDHAPRSPPSTWWSGPQAYHQLPELIARASRASGERLAADFAPEDKFDALPETRERRRRRRLPHRAGRLRQVLHLLRRALHPRRRVLRAPWPRSWPRPSGWRPRACARSPCWARTSTPTTAPASDGAPGRLARLVRRAGRRSPAWTASATPPATRATWATT